MADSRFPSGTVTFLFTDIKGSTRLIHGLGIGEITALMGKQRSPCGVAWGHLGFSVGYTAIALSSEDGERQVVICANGNPTTVAASEAFWDAAGRLAWHLYYV